MLSDLLITLLLVFLNGFFVAAEFAIVKVRSSQLRIQAQDGNRAAKLAIRITSHLDGYLAATQLGITLASLGLGWIGEPVVSKIIIKIMTLMGLTILPETAHDIALPIAFAFITVLHIVLGELAPKSIALQRSVSTTLMIAYPLRFFYFVFRPFIFVLNGIANVMLRALGIVSVHGSEVHSSDELKYLVQQGKESGTIETADYDIIKNAFDFSERTVKQIMVHRSRVSAIDLLEFNEAALKKILDENFSRIPCYEGDLDKIVGVVYLKEILIKLRSRETVNLREILHPITIVPENKRIGQLLKEFQVKRQQIAVVINEFGGTRGIITMEDILEELVGEIQDEYDMETPLVEKIGDKLYTVQASGSLSDINKLLPHELERLDEYETLAGYIIYKFRRIPNTNDSLIADEFEFTISKKVKSSIMLVKVRDLRM